MNTTTLISHPTPVQTANTLLAPDRSAPATPPVRRREAFVPGAPLRISPYGPTDQAPTTAFEREFRRRVAELGSVVRRGGEPPRRSTITALVTALRSGIAVDRLLSVARGLTPQDLADAYDHVARLRARAQCALDRLVEEPTVERFAEEEATISPLLPQMTASLRRLADTFPESFEAAVANLGDQAHQLERAVDVIEGRIDDGDGSWRVHIAELDDGRSGGIQHHPCYIPRRVGDIVPVRLAYLLGDQRHEDEQ